ncbi:EAL domain-containing protein [Motiliproteus coralliicola]|uniref:EAL domain-containing protein n=1 Tax=Motiliproteus coralliicola TaxID=2283196 RepID=A0A369W8C9_9GAMM|nr:EAL domain-containing protein [Motiliproteus coralliicola]RDE18250.1 EAL domain-containing protein [Motiliproteus coralliicola]
MSQAKLTCPFCHQAESQVQTVEEHRYQVSCQHCQATSPAVDSEDLALQLWNRFHQEVSLSKLVVNESPDIIMVKDWDGQFLLGNPALAQHYNTTPEQLIGRDDGHFNSNRAQVDFYLENVREVIRSGKSQQVEETSTDSVTGEIKHYLSVKKPFLGPSGEPQLLIIAKDVTELKDAYHELQERENRYSYAMNIAGEGIWDWDIGNNTVTHNMRWCQILGLDNSALQHPVEDFVGLLHPDDRPSVMAALDKMLADPTGNETYAHEHRMVRADGETLWILDRGEIVERDEQGKPVRVVGAIRDITESKQFELRLKQTQQELSRLNMRLQNTVKEQTDQLFRNEERFALAMRSANDGLWDWDLSTDQVYYSPRWKSMLGYNADELDPTFDTWSSLVHPEDMAQVRKKAAHYVTGKLDSFEVEMRMRHKDGNYLFIRSRAFKLIDAEGRATRLIGTHVDITDKKRSEIFDKQTTKILEMIAKGESASEIYDQIALLYESRHPGMRCSMLELEGDTLLHGGAPSLPQVYCEAVNGLKNGPEVGSCGTSTYTGKRVIVEDIHTDPKWAELKQYALPHGLRSCWSEPIKNSSGLVLGAFGMYYNHAATPNEEELNDLQSAARLAGIIMEREHNHKRMRELAYRDALTGLASRDYFHLSLEEQLQRSEHGQHRFSLLYLDLDNFKTVNDSLGHDVGDQLLQEIGRRLKQACCETDFIARLGGDEFCIILHDIVDDYYSAKVAERCLSFIAEPYLLKGREIIPSCSIGIAHFPADGDNLQALIKAADTALYEAKDQGKSRYAFYKTELTDKAEYQLQLELYLRESIQQQQLSLIYQPKMDIQTGHLVGVEALLRWQHPQLGEVAPSDFIRVAENIGMIKSLTEWVIQTVCNQLASWKQQGLAPIQAAINVHPNHFLDQDLISSLESSLNDTGISPAELELEVTETVVQTNIENLSAFQRLKALGISLAIDDFGSGYSSFASLKHMNIDVLKIDKHFIDDILNDRKAQLLVGSMIEMGHNLGYKIVAEGIETPEQHELLKELNCDLGQGYLFSEPVVASEISRLFSR